MTQEQRDEQETTQETMQAAVQSEEKEEKPEKESSGESLFAGIYEKLPNISIKAVDRFIVICVIAFVLVILIGVLKANHIF